MGVFAHRPAPIQVNYLGFPGHPGRALYRLHRGRPHRDPGGEKRFYAEKVVWLPDSYQVNDDRRAIAAATAPRRTGLPEDAFVFCNFNQSYKLTPVMFAALGAHLARVPGSVLWLLETNPHYADNLAREAERQGVAASRFIFAPTAGRRSIWRGWGWPIWCWIPCPIMPHHRQRYLWAGVPLITCRARRFPAGWPPAC